MTTPEPGLRDSTDFLERGAAVGVAAKLATYTLLPAAVVVIVVAMTILTQGSGRSITVPGLLAALLGTAVRLAAGQPLLKRFSRTPTALHGPLFTTPGS